MKVWLVYVYCFSVAIIVQCFNVSELNITCLLLNGDPKNRMDLVFMGDGYQHHEYTRFIDDMRYLSEGLVSDTSPFASFVPLFNIWAVFTPSQMSGIGSHDQPKNTVFGLYRKDTRLRGIFCARPVTARELCRRLQNSDHFGCDFPIIIANDDYYGGLGGEFTIATRSRLSSRSVLYHELAHNLGQMGEEYDGAPLLSYYGSNSCPASEKVTPWHAWITNASYWTSENDSAIEKNSRLIVADYLWHNLSTNHYSLTIVTEETIESHLQLSFSGISSPLDILLDQEMLAWHPPGHLDRFFYHVYLNLTKGPHVLDIKIMGPCSCCATCQLCSIVWTQVHEPRSSTIGLWPTFSGSGVKLWRPTLNNCLMRNMTHPSLCPICKESIWHHLLGKLSLIDTVQVFCNGTRDHVALTPLPLAQMRAKTLPHLATETYQVSWYKDRIRQPHLDALFSFDLPDIIRSESQWTVHLDLVSSEIRTTPSATRDFPSNAHI